MRMLVIDMNVPIAGATALLVVFFLDVAIASIVLVDALGYNMSHA